MPRHVQLPHPLQRIPFSVSSGLLRGLSRSRLRGSDLQRPFHGVRAVSGSAVSDMHAFAPRLRHGEWFSHLSAAESWLVPLPRAQGSPGAPRAQGSPGTPGAHSLVHVTIAAPGKATLVRGAVGHQARDPQSRHRTTTRFGLPCSDAAATWLGLATLLPLRELVVAGDHFVLEPEVGDERDPRPYVSLDELQTRTAEFHGRGKARASAALELIRQGAESRPETLLRLLIRDAKLPEPEVNPVIFDAAGRIGRADLVYRQHRVIVEYDGDQHRTDKKQYRKDVLRWQRFMRGGWDVLRMHDDALFVRPAHTAHEIGQALALADARASISRNGP